MMKTASETDVKVRVEQFRESGYTVFENVFSNDIISSWHRKFQQLKDEGYGTEHKGDYAINNMIELAPGMMLPYLSHEAILDFAESVLGPFVQIGNSGILAKGSVSKEEAAAKKNIWHRDRWAGFPRGGYQNPTALTFLCYLQDMTAEYGPIRVIPGSHRTGISIEDSQKSRPHPDEVLIPLRAGDVIVFANSLLHSSTTNTSGRLRIFNGGSYITTWMRPADNHNGPNVQRIIQQARETNDHRLLRLFGIDEKLEKRVNCGFTTADDKRWAEWSAADKAEIVPAK